MSEHIITDRELRAVKRQAKLRSRSDKSLTYMQHLDAVSREFHGVSYDQSQKRAMEHPGNSTYVGNQQTMSVSLYMQACQDAYFDL